MIGRAKTIMGWSALGGCFGAGLALSMLDCHEMVFGVSNDYQVPAFSVHISQYTYDQNLNNPELASLYNDCMANHSNALNFVSFGFFMGMAMGATIGCVMPTTDWDAIMLEDRRRELADLFEDDQAEEAKPVEAFENPNEDRLELAGYDGSIPDHFKDTISLRIMYRPVILVTKDGDLGHSFEKASIDEMMERHLYRCPKSQAPFNRYIRNRGLEEAIAEWVEQKVEAIKRKRDTAGLIEQGYFRQRIKRETNTEVCELLRASI